MTQCAGRRNTMDSGSGSRALRALSMLPIMNKAIGCHPGCLLQDKESAGPASNNRQKLSANRLT
ncbi:hypothetical protein ebA5431 [Aromatoleum aromaticum EbN1]|uniref:Uncharacterized protein n=1 Tax=Aromatoleum aromaticum (strain DSM 19018 / LMG 30748 / EbN1) TaxID=76114 RepID=Q5P0F3_AROAE|nr:hypothetical protein ebA5431 [Aromatoleum aromaticum EbN1]